MLTRKSKFLIFVSALSLVLTPALSFAKSVDDYRPFGFYVSAFDPVPGALGVNVAVAPVKFLQLHAGVGYYSNSNEPVLTQVGTSIVSAMFYLVTLSLINYWDIRNFVAGTAANPNDKSVFLGSMGLELRHPDWVLSPALGIDYGGYSARNQPFGLADQGNFVAYSAGLSLKYGALYLGAGYKAAAALPTEVRNHFYLNGGVFF